MNLTTVFIVWSCIKTRDLGGCKVKIHVNVCLAAVHTVAMMALAKARFFCLKFLMKCFVVP
jgi:hypothetical protein